MFIQKFLWEFFLWAYDISLILGDGGWVKIELLV